VPRCFHLGRKKKRKQRGRALFYDAVEGVSSVVASTVPPSTWSKGSMPSFGFRRHWLPMVLRFRHHQIVQSLHMFRAQKVHRWKLRAHVCIRRPLASQSGFN
jgi:hypothetical protein